MARNTGYAKAFDRVIRGTGLACIQTLSSSRILVRLTYDFLAYILCVEFIPWLTCFADSILV